MKPYKIISFALEFDDYQLLRKLAYDSENTISEVIRAVLLQAFHGGTEIVLQPSQHPSITGPVKLDDEGLRWVRP